MIFGAIKLKTKKKNIEWGSFQKPGKQHCKQPYTALTAKSCDEGEYDVDIKELLDTDDVGLLQEAVDEGAFDVNHR